MLAFVICHARPAWISCSLCVLTLVAGCGKDSAAPTADSAGIPLSIGGATKSDAATSAAGKLPTVEQYAQAVKQLIQKANASVVAGKNAAAIESLSQAIGVTPDDATLFRMRADVYALQREFANARADFSTAIRLAPNNADMYNFRGYFLLNRGLATEARADFNKAV